MKSILPNLTIGGSAAWRIREKETRRVKYRGCSLWHPPLHHLPRKLPEDDDDARPADPLPPAILLGNRLAHPAAGVHHRARLLHHGDGRGPHRYRPGGAV